jgi:hypothetical protein
MSRLHRQLPLVALGVLLLAASAAAEPGVDHAHVPGGQRFHTATAAERSAGEPVLYDAGVTRADGTRAQRVLVSYRASAGGVRQSVDGGTTWVEFPHGSGVANLVRLANAGGDLLAVDDVGAACAEACQRFGRRLLTATGWADAGTATVTFAAPVAQARFGPGPVLLGDGTTLLAPVRGVRTAGEEFTAVARSTDGGVTWTEVAPLATGPGWSSASISPTADGGLLAVLGKDENPRGTVAANVALYSRKAAAQSGTGWGAPVRIAADTGNAPTVRLLGNGALVLGSGRPDNVLRFSFDGKGTAWTGPTAVYRNNPATGADPDGWYTPDGAAARPLRHLGSSGTVGVAPLGGNRVLVAGDNCAPGWGCPADATVGGYAVDAVPALWRSSVEVDTDQWGKADLATMFQRGELTLVNATPVRYGACVSTADCRQSLAAYAFDGDPRADSSLVTANRIVTLRLPRPLPVTGLGLHAHLQGTADVRIETSPDGAVWTMPARGARDGVLRPFTAPVPARYVRITDPNPVTAPAAGFLHELELYTAADGFEHDYPGQPPRGNGWVPTSTLATVVDQTSVPAAERISARFLRVKDDTATQIGRATWTHAAATAVTAEFRFRGLGTTNKGVLFSLKGRNGTVAATPYGFWLTGAGRLHWANYAVSPPWGAALNATPVDITRWHTVRLVATMSQVQLHLDGTLLATRPKSQAATTVDGFELGSTGTATVGDDWLFDDVAYTS